VRWDEVVEAVVEAVVPVVVAVAAGGRAVWVVLMPQAQAVAASALAAGTQNRTRWGSRATRRSVQSAARR
jgi:hypothetical protein